MVHTITVLSNNNKNVINETLMLSLRNIRTGNDNSYCTLNCTYNLPSRDLCLQTANYRRCYKKKVIA